MTRVTSFLLCLLLIGSSVHADGLLTKAFRAKFKTPEELIAIVNPLLSQDGAVTIQPKLRTLVVQDHETNLREIESAIAMADVPSPSVEISIKLVRAEKTEKMEPIAEEIKQMARFGELLRYTSYSLIDSGLVQTEEGSQSSLSLAKDYQVTFDLDVIEEKGILRLKHFQLKKRKMQAKKEVYVPLLSLTLNLRDAETLVLGASKFEETDQALLIILNGKVKH